MWLRVRKLNEQFFLVQLEAQSKEQKDAFVILLFRALEGKAEIMLAPLKDTRRLAAAHGLSTNDVGVLEGSAEEIMAMVWAFIAEPDALKSAGVLERIGD